MPRHAAALSHARRHLRFIIFARKMPLSFIALPPMQLMLPRQLRQADTPLLKELRHFLHAAIAFAPFDFISSPAPPPPPMTPLSRASRLLF